MPKLFIGGYVQSMKPLVSKLSIGWHMQQQSQLMEIFTRCYFLVMRRHYSYLRVEINTHTVTRQYYIYALLFKSPRSGVTLCFQFVSAASAAAKTFPSHVKTVWAKPLIFGTKNIWVWGNVLDDLSMTVASISKNLLVCAIKWAPLIGLLQNVAALLP